MSTVSPGEDDLNFSVQQREGLHVISGGEGSDIDVYTVPPLMQLITQTLGDVACTGLLMDLQKIKYVDSTGLGMLVQARSTAQEHGKSFSVYAPQERILKLFMITGLDGVFDIALELPGED